MPPPAALAALIAATSAARGPYKARSPCSVPHDATTGAATINPTQDALGPHRKGQDRSELHGYPFKLPLRATDNRLPLGRIVNARQRFHSRLPGRPGTIACPDIA